MMATNPGRRPPDHHHRSLPLGLILEHSGRPPDVQVWHPACQEPHQVNYLKVRYVELDLLLRDRP
jgi:hypothetical protein